MGSQTNSSRRFWGVSAVETSSSISLYDAVGLSLLYASGYFLPISRGGGAYLLPSHNLIKSVVIPTLVFTVAGAISVTGASLVARKWLRPLVVKIVVVITLSLLCLVALKGILNVAGYEWQESIPRGNSELRASLLEVRLLLFGVAVLAIWLGRSATGVVARLLSSIGFAFTALMIFRLVVIASASEEVLVNTPLLGVAQQPLGITTTAERTPVAVRQGKPRRVVWVLFDETDFRRTYGDESRDPNNLVNFKRLAAASVFATDANSPASATLYSIPALLMGQPLSGRGVRIDQGANLSIEAAGKLIPMRQETSVFGLLAAANLKASVLGFFHPYCKIFRLDRCDSFTWPEVGGVFSAIWANIPVFAASALGHPDPWASITESSIQLLPQYLTRDDALTFIHLNVPHLPASYADKYFHLSPSSDPLTEYSRNLLFSDHVLGTIMDQLEGQKDRYDLLLVVSSDHWLRNRWYQANMPEVSRPILFSVWKVGDTAGTVISKPLSTVHTSTMIRQYLDGNLSTQAEIVKWWDSQPVFPSFIAPNT